MPLSVHGQSAALPNVRFCSGETVACGTIRAMNAFITPLGLVRWTGVAVLGSLLAAVALVMGGHYDGMVVDTEPGFFDTMLLLGSWIAGMSFAVVGVGLLTARTPEPALTTAHSREV